MQIKESRSSKSSGWLRGLLAMAVLFGGATSAYGIVTSLGLVGDLHQPQAEHAAQSDLLALVQSGDHAAAFEGAFELGDELFEAQFNALDGSGANVGQGQRFTRVPRADLAAGDQWADHVPSARPGPTPRPATSATCCRSTTAPAPRP